MSLGPAGPSTIGRNLLLRGALPTAFLAVAFAGCIKRDCVCPGEAGAAESAVGGAPLPKGVMLVGPQGTLEFVLQGTPTKVNVSTVAAEGQPFQQALRAEVKESGGSEWSVQLQAKTVGAVKKGDMLHAVFYVRALKPQEGGFAETSFVFERSGAPYTKSVTYPVRLTPEWRKVAVRFKAEESYAPGEAQMNFHLGYEPEIIELGGVSVVNYEGKVTFAQLPATEGADRKIASAALPKEPPVQVVDGGELAFAVDAGKVVRPISPYVYGINAQRAADTGTTVRRLGGNRGSAYNWELNASSAGSDWQHLNDDWPCTTMGYQHCNSPGMQYVDFALESKKAGAEAIVEVPMIDWVAADKKGPVAETEKAPSKRYVRSYPKKKGPYTDKPDLGDNAVYEDEFVNFVVSKLGKAAQGGAKFYSLDNEPALWKSTHPRVHPEPTTYKEMVTRTEALATQITTIDPSAIVLGGVMFGWSEYMSLTSAPDEKEFRSKYPTYVEYWLASMQELEKKNGRRLVHALDVHWYPEPRGTKRITEDDTSRKTIDARLQATRSFWDPAYTEQSWITAEWGKPIRLVPWLLELIAARYPGTKLSMTEYDFGAGNHISGGLAQVDVLGILGREGAYLANYWGHGPGTGELPKYISAAFRLYRNYDGKGGKYGDTAVTATTPDNSLASVFAATDSKTGALTVVVINRTQDKRYKAKIALGGASCAKADAYVLDGTSPKIQGPKPAAIEQGALVYELPPLTAELFVCKK